MIPLIIINESLITCFDFVVMIKPSTDLVMYEKYDEKTEENETGEEFKIPH